MTKARQGRVCDPASGRLSIHHLLPQSSTSVDTFLSECVRCLDGKDYCSEAHPILIHQDVCLPNFGMGIAEVSDNSRQSDLRRTSHMKPRILIVDDDEAITQQLFWTLSDDYEVVTANDLQSAVRRANIYEPAVSILDLHLPPEVESPEVGLRILDYLKMQLPESKVLVITSASGIATRKACYAVGADEFLYKPFDTEKLLTTLRRMVPRAFELV